VSLGVPAMTAHRVLFADGPVAGKTVLVAGGAGAVGHFAIELAKHAGARVVTTVSGPAKAELAAKAGADLVVNYREPGAAEKIREFGAIDRVAEVDLSSNLELDLAVLSPNSQIITYAATATDPVLSVRACMNANVSLRFVLLYGVQAEALDQAAVDITTALRDGALSELPVHRYDLADVVAAQDAVQSGAVGKVVVVPG
jgi:NADPH:quinone reductase